MKIKLVMLLIALSIIGGVSAQKKDKYDTINLNDKSSYATVNIYRVNDRDGYTPRFKLNASETVFLPMFNIGDSIALVDNKKAGSRVMFVWSTTNKQVYLRSFSPITFSIKENNMSSSVTLNPQPGGVYYLRCEAGRGFWEGTPSIKQVNEEVGGKEFKVKNKQDDE